MNNSKIVLGTSSFILAIAGAFAFKASNKVNPVSAHTVTTGVCRTVGSIACTITGGAICKFNGATLWTHVCNNKLKTHVE